MLLLAACCCLLLLAAAAAAKPGRSTLDTKKGYKTKTGSTSSVTLTLTPPPHPWLDAPLTPGQTPPRTPGRNTPPRRRAGTPPPDPRPDPPPRLLTDSWGVCRIRTGCSSPVPTEARQAPNVQHKLLSSQAQCSAEARKKSWDPKASPPKYGKRRNLGGDPRGVARRKLHGPEMMPKCDTQLGRDTAGKTPEGVADRALDSSAGASGATDAQPAVQGKRDASTTPKI